MEDRLSLYECIRDKISDYFMKQSYTASSDLMSIFGSTLGDKMLWNLLIKGLFHHLHYIPIPQLNLINENLSSRMSQLQHQQIQQRELELELQTLRNQSIMESNRKALKLPADDSLNDSDESNKSASGSQSKSTKTTTKRPDALRKSAMSAMGSGSSSSSSSHAQGASSAFSGDVASALSISSVSNDFSACRWVNSVSDDLWISTFQYLDLYSILRCERTCHYFCRVTSNNPACFSNFKYSFCPSNRSYMFRHYQRLNGINDPFYRFRHSTKVHLAFWSKENYEFRLLTAFGDRFRNVRSLTIEVNRESPLVDLSQLVKKYSNFFVSIRRVVICVHGLGQPHPNPHNRMITLYKSLISFILIRCSFIRTLTLNYSLLTQCYRHVSSCLELTQILCINSKSQLFNDHQTIQEDDFSNVIIFKMDIVNDSGDAMDFAHKSHGGSSLAIEHGNGGDAAAGDGHHGHGHHHHHHHHHRRRHSRHHSHSRHSGNHSHSASALSSHRRSRTADSVDADEHKMKIMKLGNIETQIEREIKIIFYRRHVRYSFLSYFHNHIRSMHVHNAMGFSNDIESPESRRLNLDANFGEYEYLEEVCLYNVSSKITSFVNEHCRSCPMLNRMNLIFDQNKNIYSADQLGKTMRVLLFNQDAASSSSGGVAGGGGGGGATMGLGRYFGGNDSNDNSSNERPTDPAEEGLDYDEDGDAVEEDGKTDSAYSVDHDDAANITGTMGSGVGGGGWQFGHHQEGLIPKLMRKYLNIITLNCDISSNVKLLVNLEKCFEAIAHRLGLSTATTASSHSSAMSSLLSQLNLFVHVHIDVDCNNVDEIKKLLQLLKHDYFQCDYTSYHVIARKTNAVSTPKQQPANTKKGMAAGMSMGSRFSLGAKGSKFTFGGNAEEKQPSPLSSSPAAKGSGHTLSMKSRLSIKHEDAERESNSAASTPRTDTEPGREAKGPLNVDGHGGAGKEGALLSPSILHRKPVGFDEIDDGNKSDGGSGSNSGNGLNFKEAVSKMKLFGKSMQKLIKSQSEPAADGQGHHGEPVEAKQMERTHSENAPFRQYHAPNQILRFMKKAAIHCDDICWIHDCKYAQCSRKYRTLYEHQ